MGAVYDKYNMQLMAIADYSKAKNLRNLYRKYNHFQSLAETGDSVAACIFIDLKTALYHPGVLTDRQRECIVGHLVHNTPYRELESELELAKSAIHYHVNIGLKRLSTILESGELYN